MRALRERMTTKSDRIHRKALLYGIFHPQSRRLPLIGGVEYSGLVVSRADGLPILLSLWYWISDAALFSTNLRTSTHRLVAEDEVTEARLAVESGVIPEDELVTKVLQTFIGSSSEGILVAQATVANLPKEANAGYGRRIFFCRAEPSSRRWRRSSMRWIMIYLYLLMIIC